MNHQQAFFQWMRNKEGGQSFGNQTTVRPITKELFTRFVAPLGVQWPLPASDTHLETFLRCDGVECLESAPLPFNVLVEAIEALGRKTGWVIRVPSFDAMEARQFGALADSDVSALMVRGNAAFHWPVTKLGLPARITNRLLSGSLTRSMDSAPTLSVADLVELTPGELRDFFDIGVGSVRDIERALAEHGLALRVGRRTPLRLQRKPAERPSPPAWVDELRDERRDH